MLHKIRDRAMHWSRHRKMDHFNSLYSVDQSVLDVGVSSCDWSENVNIFLKQFSGDSSLYTGLAVEDVSAIATLNPDKSFCRYDGGIFPFLDNSFDWVFSNAVIEHVGDRRSQVLFIREMCRIGSRVFFTTPNKYFPIESHTNTLFRHWSSSHFYRWCEKKRPEWNEDNLFLMSHSYLREVLEEAEVSDYCISINRMFGWPMTFTVVI